jgi:heme a synthase
LSRTAPASHLAGAAAPRALKPERAVAWWLIACCAMIYLMVVIGGITRLTESGLSITQWQPIEGVVPPLDAAQWDEAFQRYKAIPQYRAIHPDMTLAQFRTIYFWEYAHRLWGRLIGLAFAAPFLYFLLRGMISRRLVAPLAGLFVLGALQGALGWYMVASGLEDRIEVSQYRLAAHLAMAVVIYLAMLWVALDLIARRESAPPHLRRGATAALLLVFVTLVAGSFVAGTRAGYLDNTFPLMEGRFVPPDYWHLSPWYRNWFENLTSVQFDHRVLAETSWIAIALLWLASLHARLAAAARWALHALFFFACLQLALGIATLLSVVELPLAVAHQAGALALLTAALVACHALRGA